MKESSYEGKMKERRKKVSKEASKEREECRNEGGFK